MRPAKDIVFKAMLIILIPCFFPPPDVSAADLPVNGYTAPEFSSMKNTFIENFTKRNDLGASCAVYYRGEKVVDLWGGYQTSSRKTAWEQDSRTVIFSATQGIAAMAFVLAWHKGYFSYDDTVAKYWPEFGADGREGITIRQLLNMQSGLILWDKGIEKIDFFDLMENQELMESELLKIKPYWTPGDYHGYSTDIAGHLYSVLFRRIDPQRRSLGTFIREEMAGKIGADFDLGLPQDFPQDKISSVKLIIPLAGIFNLHKVPDEMKKVLGNPGSLFYKTMTGPRGYNANDRKCLETEFAGANGVANARGLAMLYNAFLTEDSRIFETPTLHLRSPKILQESGPVPAVSTVDQIINVEAEYSLGMQKPSPPFNFGSPEAFGFAGASGTFAYADPESGIAYAYVTNRMDFYSIDPRDIELRKTLKKITDAMH